MGLKGVHQNSVSLLLIYSSCVFSERLPHRVEVLGTKYLQVQVHVCSEASEMHCDWSALSHVLTMNQLPVRRMSSTD